MTPIGWPEAQRICDIPEVREALDKFAADAHDENMLAMVSAIMGHAFTQGRAAGLEALDVEVILDTMKQYFSTKESPFGAGGTIVQGGIGSVIEFAHAIRSISPTSSDAGKDDARDAVMDKWVIVEQAVIKLPGKRNQLGHTLFSDSKLFNSSEEASEHIKKNDLPLGWVKAKVSHLFDSAALSSLEAIGKGEKG